MFQQPMTKETYNFSLRKFLKIDKPDCILHEILKFETQITLMLQNPQTRQFN